MDVSSRRKKFQLLANLDDSDMERYLLKNAHRRALDECALFSTHYIVVEVIDAQNCVAGYKVGDRFVVNGLGILIPELSVGKICVAAMFAIKCLIDRFWEAFLNNSTEILHDTTRCPDVGVRWGGLGSAVFRGYAKAKIEVKS